jgi:periplasmic divalent cation tolerance protein
MSQPTFVVVLTTVAAQEAEAATLARALVDLRVAACVNVLPVMQSVYRWQGNVEESHEHQLVIKTTSARLSALREAIATLHPYEVPELLVVPVIDGGTAYLEWISQSVS